MSTKGLRVPKPECRTRGSSNCLIFPVWSTTHWYFHAQGNRNWNNGCNLESWCFLPLDKEKYNDLVFNLFSLKISAGWVGFLMIFCFVTYYFFFFCISFSGSMLDAQYTNLLRLGLNNGDCFVLYPMKADKKLSSATSAVISWTVTMWQRLRWSLQLVCSFRKVLRIVHQISSNPIVSFVLLISCTPLHSFISRLSWCYFQ